MSSENLIQISDMSLVPWPHAAIAAAPAAAARMTEQDQITMRGPICVVDDDDWVCDSLRVLLEAYGYDVLAYASGEEFLRADGRTEAKLLIIDQHMLEQNGLDVVVELHRQGIMLPTILITGRLDVAIGQRAGQLGIFAILEKPFVTARLIALIRDALGPRD